VSLPKSSEKSNEPLLALGRGVKTDASNGNAPHNKPPGTLRAIVLLGGMVRPTQLSQAIRRSILDLPIDSERSLIDLWHDEATDLSRAINYDQFTIQVAIDYKSPMPRMSTRHSPVAMKIVRDKTDYRGSGGVLHDLACDYKDDDYLLVANAAQVLFQPLHALTLELACANADVAVMSHANGLPSNLMLIRCSALRSIPSIGFVDMKEQVLPQLRSNHSIRVIERSDFFSLPIRVMADYINALHSMSSGSHEEIDPYAEDWLTKFKIVEQGAKVDPSATLHNSVILSGTQVNRGALVIRSVVCDGAIIKRNETVMDRLVSPLKFR